MTNNTTKTSNARQLARVSALWLAIVLSGCGTMPRMQLYSGEKRPDESICLIRNHPFITSLALINKKTSECLISTNKGMGKIFFEVEPGNYELKTTTTKWIYHNDNPSSMDLEAKPGRIIVLIVFPDDKARKWMIKTKDQSNNAFNRLP